ncbi:hypothetical protein [Actinoplanes sp. L3-i22]|uniref:hypothetical protein n=1 Tax=Actinoplanes sp. L3-i22 TaxID=2836373 RepID=UPI001C757CB3|nr:hypothetical protein [Actinoplanes sp. L3-i22]BCY11024.1 hypothetical protein L3i22_061120 [Actinoplanes sp. L3-i22]
MTTEPAAPEATTEDLISYLSDPRHPNMRSISELIPADHYDRPITALIRSAITGDDGRTAACARLAYRWGITLIRQRTDAQPTTATAVYCGGIRLAGYLGAHAVAGYSASHPETSGNDTLQHHIRAIIDELGQPACDDTNLLSIGLQLRRHIMFCRYTGPDLQALTDLSRVGSTDAASRPAAIGHLAWQLTRNLPGRGYGDLIRDAVQAAPLPV